MTFLVDTNVVSEITRRQPDPNVVRWIGDAGSIAMSVISLDELYFGFGLKPTTQVQTRVEQYIESYVTVLDVTHLIARHAGLLRGQLGKRGRVRSPADMLIAATAASHGLTGEARRPRPAARSRVLPRRTALNSRGDPRKSEKPCADERGPCGPGHDPVAL